MAFALRAAEHRAFGKHVTFSSHAIEVPSCFTKLCAFVRPKGCAFAGREGSAKNKLWRYMPPIRCFVDGYLTTPGDPHNEVKGWIKPPVLKPNLLMNSKLIIGCAILSVVKWIR